MNKRFLIGDFSESELVNKSKALLPKLKERAEKQWAASRILEETVADLQEIGLLQAFQPKRWGGLEAHPSEIFESIMTLAEADASVAWVSGVVGVHSFHLAQFSEQAQEDVWKANPKALIGSPYASSGNIEKVEGGYRLSGRWKFSSGCDICSWTFLGVNLPEIDKDNSSNLIRHSKAAVLLPRSDYTIEQNWNVHGLKGTGSHDIVVKDAFIPEHRTLLFSTLEGGTSPGLKLNNGPLYKLPFWQIFGRATSSVVPAGALKGMSEEFIKLNKNRKSIMGKNVAEDPALSLALAKALITVDDVKSSIHRSFAMLYDWIEQGNLNQMEMRRQFRFQGGFGPSRCAEAASELYRVFGGSANYAELPFGRALNDILAVRSHFTNHYQLHASSWIAPMMGIDFKGMPA